MLVLVFAFSTSFIVSLLLLPFIIRYSRRKKLFVAPGKRRIHKRITPSLGGVAIFAGFVTASIVWIEANEPKSFLLLTVLVIPFVIGLLDDLMHLKPSVKLIAQTVVATLVFFFLDIRLISFYGFTTAADLPLLISYLITLFTIIIITNSFNLIDGIDGLAGTFSLTALLFFGIWFYLAGETSFALLSFALAGGVMAFLFQNWEPSKIFMGDTGSLVIGAMLSILAIQFINVNFQLETTHVAKFQSSIGTAFCILIIPLVDTVRIIIIRLRLKVSPLTPDKRHIHHALVRIGLTHRQAVLVLCLVHLFFIGIAILFRNYDDMYVVSVIIISALIFSGLIHRLLLKRTFG